MLVLGRKPDQKIRIGNSVFITVLEIRGQTVKLGIDAPPELRVIRDELEPRPRAGERSR